MYVFLNSLFKKMLNYLSIGNENILKIKRSVSIYVKIREFINMLLDLK